MRIICETEEEFRQAKNMVKEYMCDKISNNECIKYESCDTCFEHNSIYIEMDEED